MDINTNLIFHIPHSQSYIPEKYLRLIPDKESVKKELNAVTEFYVDELFSFPCDKHIFPVSMLICDANKQRDSAINKFNKNTCYLNTLTDKKLTINASSDELYEILTDYYDEYHYNLELSVKKRLTAYSKLIIVDCRSFPSRPLPEETIQEPGRPDFCIGTDKYHTPETISDKCLTYLNLRGFTANVNSPYSGMTLPKEYNNNPNVITIMLGVNRKLYMNEKTLEKNENFNNIKEELYVLCELMASTVFYDNKY